MSVPQLDRFDRAVMSFAVLVLAAMGVVVLRGDQVGIGVQRITPRQTTPSQGAIQVTFDETRVTL